MKKIIVLILVLSMLAAIVASCGKTPESSTEPTNSGTSETPTEATTTPTTEPTTEPDDPTGSAEEKIAVYFKDVVSSGSLTAEEIAKKMCEIEYFKDCEAWESAWYMSGFNYPFDPGAAEVYRIYDNFSPDPNIAYVFRLGEGQTADELSRSLSENVDMNWNYTDPPADKTLFASCGDYVFFLIYNDSFYEIDYSVKAKKARELVDIFKEFRKENPTATALEIAEYLAAHQRIAELYTYAASEGYITGFSSEIHGFAECGAFAPMISPSTFIGYVFKVENTADVDAFVSKIRAEANVAWNICVVVNTVITDTSDNYVIFMMCNE